jgi:pimeloyl-ACP methyl ester carboxylesterase
VTPIVLVHGGGFAASCWDLLLDHLEGPVLAVDLPGRGSHPADLASVTITGAAASVAADVDAAGFDEVVLVGHSLAGCSMPATIGRLGDRVRHAVFVACTVPEHGTSAFDTLEPGLVARAAHEGEDDLLGTDMARAVFGNDLTDEQFAWCRARMVPEALGLVTDRVDLGPLRSSAAPRTWVRPMLDAIIDPAKQLRFAGNAGGCEVVDLDVGHMCMIGAPVELAAVLHRIAR